MSTREQIDAWYEAGYVYFMAKDGFMEHMKSVVYDDELLGHEVFWPSNRAPFKYYTSRRRWESKFETLAELSPKARLLMEYAITKDTKKFYSRVIRTISYSHELTIVSLAPPEGFAGEFVEDPFAFRITPYEAGVVRPNGWYVADAWDLPTEIISSYSGGFTIPSWPPKNK